MNKRAKRIFLFFLNFNPLSPIRLERNHFEQANISRVGRGDVVHRARLADISAVYTSLRPTSSLSPLNAPPIPRLKENFFAAHAFFAERKERGGWRETPLNLRRSWRFERVEGGGREDTSDSPNFQEHSDRPRQNEISLFDSVLPSFLVLFQKFLALINRFDGRAKDFRKNPCFSEFYKFIYIDRFRKFERFRNLISTELRRNDWKSNIFEIIYIIKIK